MDEKLDVIIFGATGYTGQYVVDEVARTAAGRANFHWGIAGRSKEKLLNILSEAEVRTGLKLVSDVELVLADVNDEESINEMAMKAKVVLNCVGPYRHYGEIVVKACLTQRCHMLDISGEPEYLETMQLKYAEEAKQQGVYIIGACGFDSAVAELGVEYTEKQFSGVLNEMECYVTVDVPKGYTVHTGTWNSLIHGIAHRKELATIRKKLYPTPLAKFNPPLASRGTLFHSKIVDKWCTAFLGSDKSVVYRSQRYLLEHQGKQRYVQFMPYLGLHSLFMAVLLFIFGFMIGILSLFQSTRRLLEKYPGFFTAGFFSAEGATREQVSKASFRMTFVGRGWSTKDTTGPMDGEIVTRVVGPDPGYITCSMCLVEAGYTVLDESQLMPESGGVFTPAAAFWNTTYLKRMTEKLEFTTLSTKKLE